MTRKRRFSVAILAACVCIAVGVLAMMPPQPGVTKANFDRIEKGMTRAEVEAILGRRADIDFGILMWGHQEDHEPLIQIRIEGDKVLGKRFVPSVETSFTDAIRRWLGIGDDGIGEEADLFPNGW